MISWPGKPHDGSVWPKLQALAGGWKPSHLSPVQYLRQLGILEAQPTLVHMVEVDEGYQAAFEALEVGDGREHETGVDLIAKLCRESRWRRRARA